MIRETFRPDGRNCIHSDALFLAYKSEVTHLMLRFGSPRACCLGYVNVEIEITLHLLSKYGL